MGRSAFPEPPENWDTGALPLSTPTPLVGPRAHRREFSGGPGGRNAGVVVVGVAPK